MCQQSNLAQFLRVSRLFSRLVSRHVCPLYNLRLNLVVNLLYIPQLDQVCNRLGSLPCSRHANLRRSRQKNHLVCHPVSRLFCPVLSQVVLQPPSPQLIQALIPHLSQA
ncbi:hypothetical protein EON64_01870 [archaeon]|nr:MAG: hypothetical protein EON64_01870 [archaeon]